MDNTITVIVNQHLSEAGRAETYSHEANGHALMYLRTKDRTQSGHVLPNETRNIPLREIINSSKMETVKNMRDQ